MIASCAFLGVLDHSVTFFVFLGTQLRFRIPSLGSFLEGSLLEGSACWGRLEHNLQWFIKGVGVAFRV